MDIVSYVILVIFIVLLILALFWEFKDFTRVTQLPKAYNIDDDKEREELYKFYTSFGYENQVIWRRNFIGAAASALVLYFIFSIGNIKLPLNMTILAMTTIFLIFYFTDNFKSYHFWRILASHCKEDIKPI